MKFSRVVNTAVVIHRPASSRFRRTRHGAQALRSLSAERETAAWEAALAQAAAAKAVAEASRVAVRKGRFETLRLVTVTLAVAYGLVAVFGYTFFVAEFFPSGLTAGDTLFFAFVALALGMVNLGLSALGALTWLPLGGHKLRRRLRDPVQARGRIERLLSRSERGRLRSGWHAGAWMKKASRRLTRVWLRWRTCRAIRARGLFICLALLPFPLAGTLWVASSWQWLHRFSSWMNGWSSSSWSFLMGAVFGLSWFGNWELLSRRRGATRLDSAFFALASLIATCGLAWTMSQPQGWELVCACLVGGFALVLAVGLPNNPIGSRVAPSDASFSAGRSTAAPVLALFALGAPAIYLVAAPAPLGRDGLIRFVFGHLGIRTDDATLTLTPEAADTVRASSAVHGVPANLCRESAGRHAMTGVRVLWYGVGQRTYIEWPIAGASVPAPQKTLRIDLSSAAVNVIRGPSVRCVDMPDSAFFQSGKSEAVTGTGQQELYEAVARHLRDAGDGRRRLTSIDVVGHADPMHYGKGSIEHLGLERAERVAELLRKASSPVPDAASAVIRVSSQGASNPLKDCSSARTDAVMRECNAVNRRVELRLHFEPVTPPSK